MSDMELITNLENPDDDACIKVMGVYEAEMIFKRGKSDKYHAMVSISDPGTPEPPFVEHAASQGLKVLRLEFEDIEHPSEGQAPDREDMRLITDFLEDVLPDLGDRCLLIHCHMGVSRSAAVAVLAWEMLGYSNHDATAKVLKSRPIADPNRLMIELAR